MTKYESIKSVYGAYGSTSNHELSKLLEDGWEPFAVTGDTGSTPVVWLRLPAKEQGSINL